MNFRKFPVNFHELCFLRFLEQAFGFLEDMRTSIEENGRSIGAFQPLFWLLLKVKITKSFQKKRKTQKIGNKARQK